ncbi:MAG: GNAT family N-acetyltransferase [Flavobacteriaceae bacterium]|nr:GNAT family N-acetyltransferase [Flavobacteriaceae bacterium]MDZ4147688.1 GNAT family N-acetyltransferase [Flavobacteriaceae bacterium]
MLSWHLKKFEELSIWELYPILRLRSQVFVVEQDCVYQDLDDKDYKALHLFAKEEENIAAYTRIFKAGDYFDQASIGRVVVDVDFRKRKLGHELMRKSIDAIQTQFNTHKIKISAQLYLKNFYEAHGFVQIGEGYLEDGIPHIAMLKES